MVLNGVQSIGDLSTRVWNFREGRIRLLVSVPSRPKVSPKIKKSFNETSFSLFVLIESLRSEPQCREDKLVVSCECSVIFKGSTFVAHTSSHSTKPNDTYTIPRTIPPVGSVENRVMEV